MICERCCETSELASTVILHCLSQCQLTPDVHRLSHHSCNDTGVNSCKSPNSLLYSYVNVEMKDRASCAHSIELFPCFFLSNPQLYGELMAKFQLKRAKSLEVYSRTPPEIPVLENDPEALAHDPALPTSAANAAAPSSPPHACSGTNTPGVLMDTSNNIKEGLSHGVLQPKTIFLQGHPHGTENEGYTCNRAAQKDATEFSSLSLNCRGGKADHHLQGVVAPSHCMQITRDLSHVMLNSQSDPTLFQATAAQQMFTSQECG